MKPKVILASGSKIRASLLINAGISIETEIAKVDEASIKSAMFSEGAPARDIADVLAETKARRIATKNPDAIVIGADQVLVCQNILYDKPQDLDEAQKQLSKLRGKTHELLSAAVIYENAKPVWRHIGRAQLMMRPFSDEFLEEYIKTNGNSLLETVGAYKLEETGSQLFTRVQGDYFSVLGLPLLEVLGFMRTRGIITT